MGCHFLLQFSRVDSFKQNMHFNIYWPCAACKHCARCWDSRDGDDLSFRGQSVGKQVCSQFCTLIKNLLNDFQFSCSVVSNSLQSHGLQHARLPCPSPIPGACSNSCPLSRWCHPTISSSVVPFSCLQSFPASGSFPMSQFFASCGQSVGASAGPSVFPMNIQSIGLTGWISLQSKGLSRVFSNTTVQKHQFFSGHLSFIVQLSYLSEEP